MNAGILFQAVEAVAVVIGVGFAVYEADNHQQRAHIQPPPRSLGATQGLSARLAKRGIFVYAVAHINARPPASRRQAVHRA